MQEEQPQKPALNLLHHEDTYRLLVDSVSDYAIFILDPKGIISTWNKGAERIKGYKAEEIIGHHFSTFYTQKAQADKYPDYELKKALELGRFEDEGWRVKKDGSTFWANVVITPMYYKKQHIGFAKITRDLTERKRNEELMNKNNELVRINNDLDNFVYTASHDLKAPITNLEGLIILLNKRLVEHYTTPQENITEVIQFMQQSVVKLKNAISDLTEIAKAQRDLDEEQNVVNLSTLLDEVKADIDPHILHSQINIHTDFRVEELLFNRVRLKSILYNLLSNAIKYAAVDRKTQIYIQTYSQDEHVVLAVKDNGLGLKKEHKAKLFTLFKRFHSHVEGTGIGLYMVKRMIENIGGWIEVESELDKGSEFRVYFKQ